MARSLADRVTPLPGVGVPRAPEVNSVFATLPPATIAPLQDWSFFWTWDPAAHLVRWMTSFATTEDDVQRFAAGLEWVVAAHVAGQD